MDNELNVAFTQANEEGQWYKSDATTNDARLQISNTKIEALKYEKVDLRKINVTFKNVDEAQNTKETLYAFLTNVSKLEVVRDEVEKVAFEVNQQLVEFEDFPE
ncbi:hypothetical protein V6N13_060098 [Hibiscus sabdariffa]